MKIIIDAEGMLLLQRGKSFRPVRCPVTTTAPPSTWTTDKGTLVLSTSRCGDWCALFSEPRLDLGTVVDISLCQGKMLYCPKDEFRDDRPPAAENDSIPTLKQIAADFDNYVAEKLERGGRIGRRENVE